MPPRYVSIEDSHVRFIFSVSALRHGTTNNLDQFFTRNVRCRHRLLDAQNSARPINVLFAVVDPLEVLKWDRRARKIVELSEPFTAFSGARTVDLLSKYR